MSEQNEVSAASKAKNKGGRPRKAVSVAAVLASPEGQEAIAAATAAVLSKLNMGRAEANTTPQDGDMSFARQLAVAIGEVTDQGRTKRIAPAELEKRREAREAMEGLIIAARVDGTVPEYELSAAVYLDEVLVAPTYIDRNHVTRRTQIAWPHVPNEQMSPINNSARNIFRAFMESIGGPTANIARAAPDANRPKDEKPSGLAVLHKSNVNATPQTGKPRNSGLQIIGENRTNEVTLTNVLGSLAAPARSTS